MSRRATVLRRLAPLPLAALLAGCAAGKAIMLQPATPAAAYQCGPYTIQPDAFFADGFAVIYYLLPVMIMRGASSTPSQLELSVTIHAMDAPVTDLTLADVAVALPGVSTPLHPVQMATKAAQEGPGQRWHRKTFSFLFDIDRHRLTEFSLLFPRPVQGCMLSPTPYVRRVERHYMTPVNR